LVLRQVESLRGDFVQDGERFRGSARPGSFKLSAENGSPAADLFASLG
jgi:hypothetical protein